MPECLRAPGCRCRSSAQLLGHTAPPTTARYVHLIESPLRAAAQRASAIITTGKDAEVVTLPSTRRRGRRG